ncbi:MAG: hypothetical protein FD123_275 [Bacteroidetes bacterium]|nr:MAG: hypothetical protein FD123_275 [Bacteroidota bacterium]
MKRYLLALLFVLGTLLPTEKAQAQVSHLIWGTSPFQDSLWSVDTTTWTIVNRIGPTLPGFTITGMTGLAYDPQTFKTFIIMKLSGVTGRVLGTIDLNTGVCTQVGNLGNNFSSITFDCNGQLFGATGNGANPNPESLFSIDKNTGVPTFLTALGNGADGEIILYNPDDQFIYHWSGNGTVIFEKFPSIAPYTPVTNIPTSGTVGGETFGAMYVAPTKFIISNISSNLRRLSTLGVYGATLSNNPDDLRGLVMPPSIVLSDDSICEEVESVTISTGNLQLFSNAIYNWGDGNSDTLSSPGDGTHVYNNPGTYTIAVQLGTGCVRDTITTFTVTVLNIPGVTITGNPNICPGGSVTLTGSFGGSSQWYLNGVAIPGATSNTYTTSTPGVYNMTKTNLNGCSDSAAVGLVVTSVPNPVVSLGSDTTVCGSIALDAQNPGATYAWNTGGTQQTETFSTSGTYNVMVTDSNGCSANDTIILVVNPSPVVSLGADTAICGSTTLDAQNTGATYAWNTGGTQQTEAVSTSGTYSVMVTDSNGCSANDTINLVINGFPVVNLGADTTVCGSITLDAQNAGATYAWNSGGTQQTETVNTSGTYSVVVTDANGCSTNDTINLTVNSLPVVNLGADTTVCGSITLDAQNAGATYAWSTSGTQQTETVSTSGAYSVMVTDANGCSSNDSINITVNSLPAVSLAITATNICADDANVTLVGTPAGGTFSGTSVTGNQFDPSIGAGPHDVFYSFTDGNGCTGMDTLSIIVSACVGIQEQSAAQFSIYPNPGTGLFTFDVAVSGSQVVVTDMLGKLVFTEQNAASGKYLLDLSAEAEGVYFVRLATENSVSVTRLVIRK